MIASYAPDADDRLRSDAEGPPEERVRQTVRGGGGVVRAKLRDVQRLRQRTRGFGCARGRLGPASTPRPKVRDRYITNQDRYPAWTAIGASALAMPGLLAEIRCTALLPD